MKKTLIFILFQFVSVNLYSQLYEIYDKDTTNFEYKYEIGLKYEKRAASSYYDKDGESVTELPDQGYQFRDELIGILPDDFTRNYSFTIDQHLVELSAKYHINDKWLSYLYLPFTYTTLEEEYVSQYYNTDSAFYNFQNFDKNNYSLMQLEYIRLGTSYKLLDGNFNISGIAEVLVPAGFDNSIINDDNDFLSDNAFEVLTGIDIGLKGKKLSLNIASKYNYRGEELEDRIIFNANLSLSTVEQTAIMLLADYYKPFNVNDEIEFDILETPLQEEILDLGVGFWIIFEDKYVTEFQYKLRLAGVHTWQTNMFNAIVRYRL
jgi:hypothetical protein